MTIDALHFEDDMSLVKTSLPIRIDQSRPIAYVATDRDPSAPLARVLAEVDRVLDMAESPLLAATFATDSELLPSPVHPDLSMARFTVSSREFLARHGIEPSKDPGARYEADLVLNLNRHHKVEMLTVRTSEIGEATVSYIPPIQADVEAEPVPDIPKARVDKIRRRFPAASFNSKRVQLNTIELANLTEYPRWSTLDVSQAVEIGEEAVRKAEERAWPTLALGLAVRDAQPEFDKLSSEAKYLTLMKFNEQSGGLGYPDKALRSLLVRSQLKEASAVRRHHEMLTEPVTVDIGNQCFPNGSIRDCTVAEAFAQAKRFQESLDSTSSWQSMPPVELMERLCALKGNTTDTTRVHMNRVRDELAAEDDSSAGDPDAGDAASRNS